MKPFLLSFLLLCAAFRPFCGSAQKLRFADGNNVWKTDLACIGAHLDRYNYFRKDTMMNGYRYLLMVNEGFLSRSEFWIREDTAARRVYIRFETTPDILLYDYNLRLGDSQQVYLPYLGGITASYKVDLVDSVSIDGIYYKIWFMRSPGVTRGDYQVIEEIGTQQGPAYPVNIDSNPDCYFQLRCFSNRGHQPVFNGINLNLFCGARLGLAPLSGDPIPEVKIVPHPAGSASRFTFSVPVTGWLIIYNALGRPVMRQALQHQTEWEIGDAINTAGIYYYQLSDERRHLTRSGHFSFY